ncbi:Ku protein [Streptomyces aureoversilis]|uniref:Ku protein n=1 Tax=Streptomyces aureoversilis TaxID=67277 RepID=A0ABV9ZTB2_9ACTN
MPGGRALWSGAIGFGLVSVPVQLVPAISEHGLELHEAHGCGWRAGVSSPGVWSVWGGRAVRARGPGVRAGGEAGGPDRGGHGRAALPSKKLFDVRAFVDASEIDVLQLDRAYHLAPAGAAANKPYVLLRDTLRQTDRIAVGKITLRTRESLALLRVHGDLLAVHTVLWPDEVRDPEGLAPPASVNVRPQEIMVRRAARRLG